MPASKRRIKITYYGDTDPKIEASKADLARIDLVDGEELHWLFMEHAGVKIYHTERYQDIFSDNWFCAERGNDSEGGDTFDVRDLPEVPEPRSKKYARLFPDNKRRQVLAYAIDRGVLTQDGLQWDELCKELKEQDAKT